MLEMFFWIQQVTTTGFLVCLKLDRYKADKIRRCLSGVLYECRCMGKQSACDSAIYEMMENFCKDFNVKFGKIDICNSLPIFRNVDHFNQDTLELAKQNVNNTRFPVEAIFSPLAMDYDMSSEVRTFIKQSDPKLAC